MANSKRRCVQCKNYYPADTGMVLPAGFFHSDSCIFAYTDKASAKKAKQEMAAEKKRKRQITKDNAAAKKRLRDNDRSFQIKKTQEKYFNPYIRLRDHDLPCISCNRLDGEIHYKGVGGKWDCGHYKTVGAFPELRFDERNAAKQCKKCNGGSGKYSRKDRSVKEGFDIGMQERYGEERLDWLNGPHEPKRYTIDNLKTIQNWYKRKSKRLENKQ